VNSSQNEYSSNGNFIATIAIRVDASTRIGSGHVMRCLTLATKLSENDCQVVFLSKQHQGNLNQFIKQKGFEVFELSSPKQNIENQTDEKLWLGCNYQEDVKECLLAFSNLDVNLIIVDHYSLDHQWQTSLKNELIKRSNHKHSVKIMAIDDLANRQHNCDILLDQTLGRTTNDYKDRVPSHCQLLLGSDFIMLRDEFVQSRLRAEIGRTNTFEIKNILITLGGTDPDNIAENLLTWLIKLKETNCEIQVTLVANQTSNFIKDLKDLALTNNWIQIISNPTSMAELMLAADISIGSSGATAWERCCLGLPTLSIISADNQNFLSENLSQAGAIINLGHFSTLSYANFEKAIKQILNNTKTYQQMVNKSFACCDGLGVKKVITAVLESLSDIIMLDEAKYDDCQALFNWQSNSEIRKFFHNPQPVEWQQHCQWLKSTLRNKGKHLYMIRLNSQIKQTSHCVGMLRLDPIKDSPPEADVKWEISIIIDPKYQGKKLADKALNKLPGMFIKQGVIAKVHSDNFASHKLFLRAGFSQVSATTYCLKEEVVLGVSNA